MEFGEEQNCVPGCVPEFGAIFMSNTATKRECFRLKLLGLPSSQAHFVKQVKTGMILFLFEFERRELHGVFQASSDGAMNIVPNAYSASGKQFPAQVKFTPLWHCSPLSEDEFGDAIQENYYATKKFNFGLSENQVCKLLYLFSLRKLKPQRQIYRNKFATISRAANEDTDFGSAISTVYPGFVRADSSLKPSLAFRSVESQVSNLSCRTSTVDVVPYDPEAPAIDTKHLLSRDFAQPIGSGFGYSVSLTSPNQYENSGRARMSLLEAAYSENIAPVCSSDCVSVDCIKERPSNFLNPTYIPSFVSNCGYYEASQEKHCQQMSQSGINEACEAKEDHSRLQDHYYSARSPDHHINISLKPDICENNGGLYSDCPKERESVFSRLALASKGWIEENEALADDDEDISYTSVNEVMSMLYQSRYHWLKTKKSRQLIKDNAISFEKKRKRTSNYQSSKAHIQKISKEAETNYIPASAEGGNQFFGKTTFVDFRRRSEVCRIYSSNTKIGNCNENAETEGISSGLCKRRKLIRPDFSKNELPDDKSVNINTNQNVVLPILSSQISHLDSNISEAEILSGYKGEEIAETYGEPSHYVVADGKELSPNVPSAMSSEHVSNVAEQGLIIKESTVDGSSQDLSPSTHCIGQESSLEASKRDATGNGITSSRNESCGGNEKGFYPKCDIEITVDTVKDSSNENPNSEKPLNETVTGGCEDCKRDFQKIFKN